MPRGKSCIVEGWPTKGNDELLNLITPDCNIGLRLDGLVVVDFERPELVKALFEEGIEVLAQRTWVAKTGKGYHVFMRGEVEPVRADGLLELRSGSKQYVVVPPSLHPTGAQYEWVSDVRSVEITNVSQTTLTKFRRKVEVVRKLKGFITAMTDAWQKFHRHNLALWTAGALRKNGYRREEVETVVKAIALLSHDEELEDRVRAVEDSFQKPITEIAGWMMLEKELKGIVGREKALELLNLLPRPNEPEEKGRKEKPVMIMSKALPGPLVLEAVGVRNGLGDFDARLLVLGPSGFELVEKYVVDGKELEPQHPRHYPYRPYIILDFDIKTRAELIDLVHREVEMFVDAEPAEKALFTAAVMLSYVQEQFESLPYIFLIGDNESGKSHLLTLFAELCYRPLWGVSHTAADLYSYLEDGIPLTIIEDEFQGSENDNEKMKIYKAGYKRGARIARVTVFEGGRRVDYFNCYGLKLMAAEKTPDNKGFLERCIMVEMVEGLPAKDHYDCGDFERFTNLRSQLLKWRMRVLGGFEALPVVDFGWLRGRVRELYLPLLTVLHGHPLYTLLERKLRDEAERRREEKTTSLEAFVCRAAVKQLVSGRSEVVFRDLWDELLQALGGEEEKHPLSMTARAMQTETCGRVTKVQVGKILSKLGMHARKITRGRVTVTAYLPDMNKLRRAVVKYGVEDLQAYSVST